MDRIGILIVDDHTLFRKGMLKMLEAEADLFVLGEAGTGQEALTQARSLMPDVILMDIKMPDMDGIEVTRLLHRELPHLGIIFCTMFADDELVFSSLKAGGRGYILKDSHPETMLRAIRAVANGESLLAPSIAPKVLHLFDERPWENLSTNSSIFGELTARERDVLSLLAQGLSNKEISLQLSISEKTVKNHITNIFSKLHVLDRTQAAIIAIKKGFVSV
jgi:DNA-binding NarL/FixJ family response regulator